MFDIVRYWLDMGVDGFRLDVINWFIKDEQFRSNPYVLKGPDFQNHIYDRNRPETIEICKELRKITDSYEERMLVGEVYTDNPQIASSYYGENNDGLHMAFNFNFLFQPWNAVKIYKSILQWYDNLSDKAWPNFTFSNHDNLRHCYRYKNKEWSDARARVAAVLLITLKGTPFIYYGEELGMTGGKLKRKDMVDPLSIKTWPLKKYRRDLARTPMQWQATDNAGFSKSIPWLPLDSNYTTNNVEIQEKDEKSLLSFYKKLIWMRKDTEALQTGSIRFIEEYLPNAIVYIRELGLERILIVLNFTKKNIAFKFKTENKIVANESKSEILLSSNNIKNLPVDLENGIEINPYEAIIIKL
jgi:alpha-glucosidase